MLEIFNFISKVILAAVRITFAIIILITAVLFSRCATDEEAVPYTPVQLEDYGSKRS